MPPENPWSDPRTWVSIISLGVAVASLLFAFLSFRWNRGESRLDALGHALRPMLRAAQHLRDANESRKKREQLRVSFPDTVAAPEAAQRMSSLLDDYHAAIAAS